ncbi:MAG: HIT family protein [Methylococcaceae bacterium]|nr:HIT family protein [Methylococcaceae bacterium]
MIQCDFCDLVEIPLHAAKIIEFEYSVGFLNVDQSYPGRSVLILKQHFEHFHEIPLPIFAQFNCEMRRLAEGIDTVFKPDRLNYAVLGNLIAHVHWHVIPRYRSDENWGGPPWPIKSPQHLPESEYRTMAQRIGNAIV